MPDLIQESTAVPNPLPPSLYAAPPSGPPDPPSPPTSAQDSEELPPFPWEDHPAFRFTFLLHFTQPKDREALEHVGKMLYESALEMAGKWPTWRESPVRAELRAAAADLRHVEAFIASVAGSRHVASLSPEDERLTFMADTMWRSIGREEKILESLIGPLWKGGIRK
jgi:hypothetical protein